MVLAKQCQRMMVKEDLIDSSFTGTGYICLEAVFGS